MARCSVANVIAARTHQESDGLALTTPPPPVVVCARRRPDGLKKAYVRLTTDYDALDVANKIGII